MLLILAANRHIAIVSGRRVHHSPFTSEATIAKHAPSRLSSQLQISSRHQHMATEYQIQIATPVHYKKVRGARTAVWARDSHVTSTMPTPTPYDRTTPPTPAHFHKPLPPTPRQTSSNAPTSLFAVRPHATAPRPAALPREHGLQDDLYYAFTRDAHISSSTPDAQGIANRLNLYCPRPQAQQHQQQRTLPLPNIPVGRRPRTELERLHASGHPGTMATQISNRQLPPLPLKPAKTWANSTFTFEKVGQKKRRPSEIFNINFGFHFSSRRRTSSDSSPNISPRTSISSASGTSLPSKDILDSFKRQRIDSTDSDVAMVFGIDQETLRSSTYPNFQAPVPSPPSSTRCDSGEAHPGHLVDFTSPDYSVSGESEPLQHQQTKTNSDFNLRLDTDAYHAYLASTTQRRKSFPTTSAARRIREEIAMLHKLDNLDTEAKTFNSSLNMNADANTRKRVRRTLENQDIGNKRQSSTPPSAPTTTEEGSVMEGMNGGSEIHRSSSDPSTQAFLAHIRASLSARQTKTKYWSTYPVFTDEAEKGFLDDAPL
jgi:hypothetical protein